MLTISTLSTFSKEAEVAVAFSISFSYASRKESNPSCISSLYALTAAIRSFSERMLSISFMRAETLYFLPAVEAAFAAAILVSSPDSRSCLYSSSMHFKVYASLSARLSFACL